MRAPDRSCWLPERSNRDKFTLYCFSPPVMIATFAIEIVLAAYTFLRYRAGRFGRTAAAILVLLALFQLSEYQVCGGSYAILWSRIGLGAITILPVLGLYLVSLINRETTFLRLGYALAVMFAIVFVVAPKNIVGSYCGGNYIVFSGPEELYRFYAVYYFSFLILAVWDALRRIPPGETRTYAQMAEVIGAPRAVRAVARAIASNHAAVVVPCHRVVPASGGAGGYRWGEARKRELLRRERVSAGAAAAT